MEGGVFFAAEHDYWVNRGSFGGGDGHLPWQDSLLVPT